MHQGIQCRLKLDFHVRGIEVDVVVHGLDVHLVRGTAELLILGIVAHAILNDGPFQDV